MYHHVTLNEVKGTISGMASFAPLRMTPDAGRALLLLHQLHPPVLLPPLGGVVGAHRLGLSQALRLQAGGVDLVVVDEVLPDRRRPLLAQRLVGLRLADVVGV